MFAAVDLLSSLGVSSMDVVGGFEMLVVSSITDTTIRLSNRHRPLTMRTQEKKEILMLSIN